MCVGATDNVHDQKHISGWLRVLFRVDHCCTLLNFLCLSEGRAVIVKRLRVHTQTYEIEMCCMWPYSNNPPTRGSSRRYR